MCAIYKNEFRRFVDCSLVTAINQLYEWYEYKNRREGVGCKDMKKYGARSYAWYAEVDKTAEVPQNIGDEQKHKHRGGLKLSFMIIQTEQLTHDHEEVYKDSRWALDGNVFFYKN